MNNANNNIMNKGILQSHQAPGSTNTSSHQAPGVTINSDFRPDAVGDEGTHEVGSQFPVTNREAVKETNRDAIKDWIKSNAVDVVIQFQSRSDAITRKHMVFTPSFPSRTARRGSGASIRNNYAKPIIVPIGSHPVDAIETERRLLEHFLPFIRHKLHCSPHMLYIVEDYGSKKPHATIFLGNLHMKHVTNALFLNAARAAHLTIGEYQDMPFIKYCAQYRHHFARTISYSMKSLHGDAFLENTQQMLNSSDVWGMSPALLNRFRKQAGLAPLNVQRDAARQHSTPRVRYANISHDLVRYGGWK